MCLSAIYWADIRRLCYSAGRVEAEKVGFMDSHLYDEIALPATSREIITSQLFMEKMETLLEEWNGMEGKVLY